MKKTFTILFFLFISQFTKAQELKLFKDLYPGKLSSYPTSFFHTDNHLFFSTVNNFYSSDNPLWISDGIDSSNSNTFPLLDIGTGFLPGMMLYQVINNKAFFIYTDSETPQSLWVTDGTISSTKLLKTFDPSNMNYTGNNSYAFHNKLYFLANSDSFGIELWVSDGTEIGTKQLKDINKSGNSAPYHFKEFDSSLYFSAEGTTKNRQLWKTDGTEQGTVLVKDFSSIGGLLSSIYLTFQNKLILCVKDSIHGYELWETDGTDTGTKMIKDINPTGNSYPSRITIFKNKMYFTADDGNNGREIWTSDGTTAGTQLFMDINKSTENKYPYEFYEMNGKLYFNAYDETNGYEVWKTDGTINGTKILKNMIRDKNKIPYNFVSIGENLFFKANAENIGDEVYISDGTETGTKILEPKNRTQINPIRSEPLIIFQEKLFVVGNYEATFGEELYVYDPNENTSSIKQITGNSSYFYPNPAQNEIKIKNNTFTKVDIYDVNGRLVLESTNTKESIDISSIPAGIYIVKMGNENTQITERLIKY